MGCKNGLPLNHWEPNYEPRRWNCPKVKDTHNCFSYALNVIDEKQMKSCENGCTKPFPQPGAASGYKGFSERPKTASNMMARVIGDNPGIRMSELEDRCPAGTSKIIMVADEDEDYHFIRQDSGGYWSHKSGARSVTNVDAGGHKIWNPLLADYNYKNKKDGYLNYNIYCGALCVPRNKRLYTRTGGSRSGGGSATRRVR
jgi:hypothetical protein